MAARFAFLAVLAATTIATARPCAGHGAKALNSPVPPVTSVSTGLSRLFELPAFSLQDGLRQGTVVGKQDLRGKVSIVSFFFTGCDHVCSFIMGKMAKLSKNYRHDDDIQMISFTTDPRHDTAPALAKYAGKFGAVPGQWWFLTGDPAAVVGVVKEGFKLAMSLENPNMHSEKFAVVDENGWVRGYFNSSSKADLDLLDEAVAALKKEMSGPRGRAGAGGSEGAGGDRKAGSRADKAT